MKVSKGTVIRTAILVLAIINNFLALFGKSPLPIDNETIVDVVSFIFTTVASLVTWWKNNSFTESAIIADAYLNSIRDSKVQEDKKCK